MKYRYLKLTSDEATDGTGPIPVTIPEMDVVTSGLGFVVGFSVYLGR